jgi:hypothetical protein
MQTGSVFSNSRRTRDAEIDKVLYSDDILINGPHVMDGAILLATINSSVINAW